ncbi:MAG: type II CAAX endopeptidase family protein [Actinomycetota bacterium]
MALARPFGERRPTDGVIAAVAVLVLTQLVGLIWAVIMAGIIWSGEVPDPFTPSAVVLLTVGLWAGYGIGSAWLATSLGDGPGAEYGATIKLADVPVGAAIGVGLQIAVLPLLYFVIGRFIDIDPSESARELVNQADGVLDLALLVVAVVVMAPLVEELFFRGLLLQSIDRAIGPVPAVLISSVVFALVHVEPIVLPGLFLFGVVASVITLRTGSLGIAWALHAAFNLTTVVLIRAGVI